MGHNRNAALCHQLGVKGIGPGVPPFQVLAVELTHQRYLGRIALREARAFSPREFRVVASPQVVELFLDEESPHLAGLSDFIGKPISLTAESSMTQEQYDIVLM